MLISNSLLYFRREERKHMGVCVCVCMSVSVCVCVSGKYNATLDLSWLKQKKAPDQEIIHLDCFLTKHMEKCRRFFFSAHNSY